MDFPRVAKKDSLTKAQPAAQQDGRARFWTGNLPGSESSRALPHQKPVARRVPLFERQQKPLCSPGERAQKKLEGERMKGERQSSSSSRSRYPDLTGNICQVAAGQRGNSLKLAGAQTAGVRLPERTPPLAPYCLALRGRASVRPSVHPSATQSGSSH